jgi:hypothetical protein
MTLEDTSLKSSRRPYEAPELRTYGSVTSLGPKKGKPKQPSGVVSRLGPKKEPQPPWVVSRLGPKKGDEPFVASNLGPKKEPAEGAGG